MHPKTTTLKLGLEPIGGEQDKWSLYDKISKSVHIIKDMEADLIEAKQALVELVNLL